MESFLQLLVSGIAFGCIYTLVAIEYSVIYQASGLVNFSHGQWITLGGFVFGGTMIRQFNMHYIPAMLLSLVVMGIFGALVAKGIFNPLRHLPNNLFVVLGTVMLGKIIIELCRIIWGASAFRIEGFLSDTVKIGGIVFPEVYIWIVIISVIFLVVQAILFQKTKLGKAMRCVASDQKAAALMGINVNRNIIITVAYSAIICAIIGILVAPIFNVDINMANSISLKGFAAGVVGGFGTIGGSIVGGLVIGIIENMYLMIGPAIYKDVVAFVALIIFLLMKPTGLLGKNQQKRS
ncbi:MAG TPA: branched-chain amino acid ABC transporter permease [Clostridiaceae bacterium]|nr:branched-chain amino acid ABC transporter permease [Clostridiaceae bacterium]